MAESTEQLVQDLAEAEAALRESERRYRLLAASATDLVLRHSTDGKILYASPSSVPLLGRTQRELIDTEAMDLIHPDDVPKVADELRARPGPHEVRRVVARCAHADGRWVWMETLWRRVVDPISGKVELHTSSRDITDHMLDRQLLHESEARFRTALHSSPAAIALVDVDHQPLLVNSAMERLTGRSSASLLQSDWRHWVLAEDQPLLGLVTTLGSRRVTRPVEVRFLCPDGATRWGRLTVSVLDPEPAVVPALALVAPRPAPRGYLVQAQDVTQERQHLGLMERRLRPVGADRSQAAHALRAVIERGGLQLQLQPIVRLADRELVGHEGLLRLVEPGAPPSFPRALLAGDPEAYLVLGSWVVDEAIALLHRRWQAGHRTWLGMNLDGVQLTRTQVTGRISQLLGDLGLPPELLHVELTESTEVLPDGIGRAEVDRLVALGCQLWLDDFGTGFSSLTYVHGLPVKGLKIDRTFVAGLDRDRRSEAIVHSILDLARRLDLEVVAEGVERADQADRLAELGCHYGQGYLFGRAEADRTRT